MTHSIRKKHGTCPLCQRQANLTFHHLIPKKMHRRTYFRKHIDKTLLNSGIEICRACHSGIHKLYDEMTLAKRLNTLAQLRNDEAIMQHCSWVAKQRRQF